MNQIQSTNFPYHIHSLSFLCAHPPQKKIIGGYSVNVKDWDGLRDILMERNISPDMDMATSVSLQY